MEVLRVSEVFESVQGEGRNQGRPCTFVRLYGCDMRCSWCDTTYAVEGGGHEEVPIADLIDRVEEREHGYVCITGGEPLIQEGVSEFVDLLAGRGFEVDLETNGAHRFDHVEARVVMDVKTPSSGEISRLELLDDLSDEDDLKFVVGDEEDYRYAKGVLKGYGGGATPLLQPVGGTEARWLAERAVEDCLDARVQVQLHRLLGLP